MTAQSRIRKSICILGTPLSSGNRGVQALAASLVQLLTDTVPQSDITFLLVHPRSESIEIKINGGSRNVNIINCRLSPRAKMNSHLLWILAAAVLYRLIPSSFLQAVIEKSTPWIKVVAEAEWVGDIRGGDSFSDIYGVRPFLIYSLLSVTVILVKGRMVHLPQTYGPFAKGFSRWLGRCLLKSSSCVFARDSGSQAFAQDLVGSVLPIELSPDVAFAMHAARPLSPVFEPPLTDFPGQARVGININGLMFSGGYTRKNMFGIELDYPAFLKSFVTSVLEDPKVIVHLIPHTYAPKDNVESDNWASHRLRQSFSEEFQSRIHVLEREYDPHELKGLIGACDFFLGSRMHACIAALSQAVPCIGVAYSGKFHGVFDSVGALDWIIDGRSENNEGAIKRAMELYRRRDSIRPDVAQRVEIAKNNLRAAFLRLSGSLKEDRRGESPNI